MNERIQKLAEKAKVKVWHNGGGLLSDKAFEIVAELIVQECAGIYSRIDNGNLHMGTDDYLLALQKHFGVEE